MDWARILAYITGTVDQELLLRNEYLAAENRILKAQLQGRLRLSDAERVTLGEIGHRLAARRSARWRLPLCQTPSRAGTESSSPANSMDRAHVEPRAGRRSAKKSRKLIIRMAKENRSVAMTGLLGR
jgi:hypothetical protein